MLYTLELVGSIKEGSHNKALHVVVQYKERVISHVFIDPGSWVNICPLVTLISLEVNMARIQPRLRVIRAFYGSRETLLGNHTKYNIRNCYVSYSHSGDRHLRFIQFIAQATVDPYVWCKIFHITLVPLIRI